MTGAEIIKCLETLQKGKIKAFYPFGGIKMEVALKPTKHFVSANFSNGEPIIPEKNYTGATHDYLFYSGDDFGDVWAWYEPRAIKKVGSFMEEVKKYMREVKRLNSAERPLIDPKAPRVTVIDYEKVENLSSDSSRY
jgi:hypothetical protein